MSIESTGFLAGSQISADKVDGFDASQTPTAGTILVLDSNAQQDGSTLVAASVQNDKLANANIGLLSRWARPGKLLASDGTTLKQITHDTTTTATSAADGDKMFMYFICDGTETKLEIGMSYQTGTGKYDVYLNGTLDTGGTTDTYAGSSTGTYREVVLSGSVVKGLNTIEFRVNGKNASSSGYALKVFGASLQ